MAGAFLGVTEGDAVINVGVSGPGVVKHAIEQVRGKGFEELCETIKKTAFKVTRVGQLVAGEASQRLGIPFGIVDLSLAPTPAVVLGCAGALILILVSQHGTGHTSSVKGDVLCIVSAVSYATYLTAFRNVIVRYSPVTTMKWMFLFAAVAALAIYWRPLTEVDYAAVSPRIWGGVAYVFSKSLSTKLCFTT